MKTEFSDKERWIDSPFGRVKIKPFQIVFEVRLFVDRFSGPFPAILDSGMNHNFFITEMQLTALGLEPADRLGRIKVGKEVVPLRRASLYLGNRELRTERGIAVWPGDHPRLPLLGMRAIVASKMKLVIDGKKMQASLSRPFFST